LKFILHFEYHFTIDTENTFPHSSGIASSASGMAAASYELNEFRKALNPTMTDEYFLSKGIFTCAIRSEVLAEV
jgi:diphosphomevalonate decarboxylase